VSTRLQGSLRSSQFQPLGTVSRQLSAERQFGAVFRELEVHRSASTIHILWVMNASSLAPDRRMVYVILSSPFFLRLVPYP
jgi:hypothetical protein